jgi:hypothetical protein
MILSNFKMNIKKLYVSILLSLLPGLNLFAANEVGIWMKFEKEFISSMVYDNPLYDVKKFVVQFISPTGRIKNINGFWDGGKSWKVRFCPDEMGKWNYMTNCSDEKNAGLHVQKGAFNCVPNDS